MANWIAPAGGIWYEANNWDNGDIPDTIIETASFSFATNSGGNHFIDIIGGVVTSVAALNVTLTGSTGLVLQGTGVGSVLRLDGGASDAYVTINTAPGGGSFSYSSAAGSALYLGTRTIFNVVNAGSTATIGAALGGLPLVKTGAGTLVLTNTATGGPIVYVEGGTLVAPTLTGPGGNRYYLSNGSTLQISGVHSGGIATTGTGGGTILVPTGQTLTVSGSPLSHLTSGRLTFGSATHAGTIVIDGNGFSNPNDSNQTILIAGGTLRLTNISTSDIQLNAGGGIELRNGAVVESYNLMRMHNLVLNNGTVRVFFNLEITATANALTVQNGTFEGNAAVNQITVNVEGNYSLAGASFVNWTAGTDLITMTGNAANNIIFGSSQRDTINGGDGADKLVSGGGGDVINGDGGTDNLVGGLLADIINGGADADKIRGDGGADTLTGGAGPDVFKYRAASDSGLGAAADIITDFVSGTDRLNFSKIDANAGLAGDQAFTFVGTGAFTGGGAGSIRYVDTGNDIRVEADVNGDGFADMEIILQGAGLGAGALSAADFVL